jgi:hypothetical protein
MPPSSPVGTDEQPEQSPRRVRGGVTNDSHGTVGRDEENVRWRVIFDEPGPVVRANMRVSTSSPG